MTNAHICPDDIKKAASGIAKCEPVGKHYLVTTNCLYPSGGAVQVLVQPAADGQSYRVSDMARGVSEVRSTGHSTQKPGMYLASSAREFRVSYSAGAVHLSGVKVDELKYAILFVSNASLYGVVRALENLKFPARRNFLNAFESFITDRFQDKFKKALLVGQSSKVYEKDYVYQEQKIILVDPVINTHMTVANAVSENLDIFKSPNKPDLQIITYDEEDAWKESDLRLLRNIGVNVMAYDKLQTQLPQLIV